MKHPKTKFAKIMKSIGKDFKPLVKEVGHIANKVVDAPGHLVDKVAGVANNMTLPLLLIGGAVCIYMIQKT